MQRVQRVGAESGTLYPRATRQPVHRQSSSNNSSNGILIALGIMVFLLTIAVAWVALRPAKSGQDTRADALLQRVTSVEGALTSLRTGVETLAKQTQAAVNANAAAIKKLQGGTKPTPAAVLPLRCAAEVQAEIDDIRGYIAYGTGITRRVTPDCKAYLQPRYGG